MEAADTPQMVPLLEGEEAEIQNYSQRLEGVGIANTVEMAEDCRPNACGCRYVLAVASDDVAETKASVKTWRAEAQDAQRRERLAAKTDARKRSKKAAKARNKKRK